MTDRPILFSAPMVRALLDGTKTQTRRVLKPQPNIFEIDERGTPCQVGIFHDSGAAYNRLILGRYITLQKVPFCIGDRLWVREAWTVGCIFTDCVETRYQAHERASYTEFVEQIPIARVGKLPKASWPKYAPSIHMPRWASRLTLTVTDVRVERLQDISREDAIAEGLTHKPGVIEPDWWVLPEPFHQGTWLSPVAAYRFLWNEINGPGAWEANPWVVAISFTVGRHNIDQVPA